MSKLAMDIIYMYYKKEGEKDKWQQKLIQLANQATG